MKRLFMSATILCGLLVVSFTFKLKQISWLWTDHLPVAIVLSLATLGFGIQWYHYHKLDKKQN